MRSGKKIKKNKKLGRILREVEAKCELDDKTKPPYCMGNLVQNKVLS